jgi:hypothetical protein
MQVFARKSSRYESYEQVKKREFERISLFRPLPVVSVESIETEPVEEPVRHQLALEEFSEEETVELDSFFEQFATLDLSVGSVVDAEEPTAVSSDPFANISLSDFDFGEEEQSDDLERELEELARVSALEATGEPTEDFSSWFEGNTVSEEKSNTEQIEGLDELPTLREYREEVFRSDYVGLRREWNYVPPKAVAVPKLPKVDERKVLQPRKLDTPISKTSSDVGNVVSQPVQNINADKSVRQLNEDFVAYCRRNLRVQERVALDYFSPSEIESAVKQGKVLRKSGLLIFAHS